MLNDLFYRLRVFFNRSAVDSELDEELSYHLDRQRQKYMEAGLSAEEALRKSRLNFGGPEQIRQQVRDGRGTRLIENLAQDLRYGIRALAKNPGFTIVVILTLGLGIGACTAIFSLVSAVLLPPLPYGDTSRLVYLYTPSSMFRDFPLDAFPPNYADFADLRSLNHSFSRMTEFQQDRFRLAPQLGSQHIGGVRVDASFFPTLESLPEIGRTIDATDDQPGHDRVVVISHSLWQQLFAGNPQVLNQSLQLNDSAYRIIGVMPAEFGFPHRTDIDDGDRHIPATDIWIPLAVTPKQRADRDGFDNAYALARLRPDVSIAQAQAEMSTLMKRNNLLHTSFNASWGAFVKPFRETLVGASRPLLWLLFGAVCFVLLTACGNAANLLLARSASRTHELGMRATLGAGRSRLISQLLTESLLIGLAGGATGVGLAYLFLRALLRLDPGNIPRLSEARLDTRVLLFTLAVSLVTSSLTGILPALSSSRVDLVAFMKSGVSRGIVGSRNRLRNYLIVAEVSLVVVLLAGAGLLLRSYANIESVNTGFSSSTISMKIDLDDRYSQATQRQQLFDDLIDRLTVVPGVQAVGAIDNLPLSNSNSMSTFWAEGYANRKGQTVETRQATPNYFSAMNIPVLDGRSFNDGDRTGRPEVAIINQAFAKKYFSGRSPIGRWVRGDQPDNPTTQYTSGKTIVGIVGDVRHSDLETPPGPQLFLPVAQGSGGGGFIVVRSVLPAKEIAATAQAVLRKIDPALSTIDVQTMGELVSQATARRRFQTTLLTVFSAMALLLALVGLYGLLAYSVRQRTAEMGVRIALGAARGSVMSMVVREGLQLVGVGLLLGLTGAFALTRLLASYLYGVRATDPLTFALVPALLLLASFVACLIPAWKAARIDPIRSLRYE